MKILSIKGKNLASLEGEFAVDFRTEPLRSAGIFAITGNTGSGKTTLLDAMCIALFQISPRTYKAKGSKSQESEDDNIRESDCRNILRHGTGDGYSEVEFLALDGKEYRVRWSVSRARNKADGNLQPSKHTLFCIDDNCYIQGSKAETKATVAKLLGLNYEQFTRAVLLAQGEFASFLKATPNDKADILEKLTGTGIYAQISVKIFDKYRITESQYKAKEEIINGMRLLSPEEENTFKEELNTLVKEEEKEVKAIETMQEKLKWIEQMQKLSLEFQNAEKIVAECNKAVESIKETTKRLSQIESIQPIRDTYIEAVRLNKEREQLSLQLPQYNKLLIQHREQYETIEKAIALCVEEQKRINKERAESRPIILEATKLEADINSKSKQLEECLTIVQGKVKQLQLLNDEHKRCKTKIKQAGEELTSISQWIAQHNRYASTIERRIIIENNLNDTCEIVRQIDNKSKMLASSQTLQKQFEESLAFAQSENERLKATLTQEIAALRSRLIEGEPCPVCGSCHHQISVITGNVLQEKELIKARKTNEESIAHHTRSIENCKAESMVLSSSIEEYKQEYKRRLASLLEELREIPETEKLHKSDNPLTKIKEIVDNLAIVSAKWNNSKERITKLQQSLSVEGTTQNNLMQRISEIEIDIKDGEQQVKRLQSEVADCKKRVKELLGEADSVIQIEERFESAIKECDKKFTHYTAKRIEIITALSQTEQNIKRSEESIAIHTAGIDTCKKKVEEFLQATGDKITIQLLSELVVTEPGEIAQMRRRIEHVNNNLIQATTKLQERKQSIDNHMQHPSRPTDDEEENHLITGVEEKSSLLAQYRKRITQINVELSSNTRKKEECSRMLLELKAIEEQMNDWKKLNDMFGSAKGHKFRLIAQGYTLDIMLAYANIHLKELSSRYELVRSAPDSLSLMVTDLDMLSERRTVNTLSGGETFLVSLALALALSSLSSNNMSIESLFIDEGFGSLDSETLRIAMEALEKLQSQGRKIGVISHLQDMIERIPTQICIKKGRSGKSVINIKS